MTAKSAAAARKRQAPSEPSVPGASGQPERMQVSEATSLSVPTRTPLAQLTKDRVRLPTFDEVFSSFGREKLGEGLQGAVYKTRIVPAWISYFPAAININDFYAVKVSSESRTMRENEAKMSLWLGQLWNKTTMPNVARIKYWMRLREEQTYKDQDATIMDFISGGTSGSLLNRIADDLLPKTEPNLDPEKWLVSVKAELSEVEKRVELWNLAVRVVIAQTFAGICEIRAAGVRNFVHGDLHQANVLAQPGDPMTCFVLKFKDDSALAVPTWFCKDFIMRIIDFGQSSGSILTARGEQVVTSPLTNQMRDNEKFCLSIQEGALTMAGKLLAEIQAALPEVQPFLKDQGKFNKEAKSLYEDTDSTLNRLLSATTKMETWTLLDDLRGLASYIIEIIARGRSVTDINDAIVLSLLKYKNLAAFYVSTARRCLSIFIRAKILSNENEPLLDLLESHPDFAAFRTKADQASLDKFVTEKFLNNDASRLKTVQWVPISLVPAKRVEVEYVQSCLPK